MIEIINFLIGIIIGALIGLKFKSWNNFSKKKRQIMIIVLIIIGVILIIIYHLYYISNCFSSEFSSGELSTYCASNGNFMSLQEAVTIAENSECAEKGVLKNSFMCNSVTSTWWIDLEPNTPQQGCNPACVINIVTEEVEINWRCTGLMS